MNEGQKKQLLLRISPKLYEALAGWAEDDFRSINGQIEYLLTECVRQRKKNDRKPGDAFLHGPCLRSTLINTGLVYNRT